MCRGQTCIHSFTLTPFLSSPIHSTPIQSTPQELGIDGLQAEYGPFDESSLVKLCVSAGDLKAVKEKVAERRQFEAEQKEKRRKEKKKKKRKLEGGEDDKSGGGGKKERERGREREDQVVRGNRLRRPAAVPASVSLAPRPSRNEAQSARQTHTHTNTHKHTQTHREKEKKEKKARKSDDAKNTTTSASTSNTKTIDDHKSDAYKSIFGDSSGSRKAEDLFACSSGRRY